MRICAALVLLAMMASACGGGSSRPATPSPIDDASATAQLAVTPVSPPIATATPGVTPTPAPVLRTSGKLVFLRGKDLWVANLDGSGERQLTSGSLGAGYAGYTRDTTGRITLYYTSEVALTGGDSPSPATGAAFTVYRTPLDGGPAEELFSFHGTMKHDEFSSELASVSPDGRHVAYSDDRGLNRFDLDDRQDVTLLEDVSCSDPGHVSNCHGFYKPAWSPRGDLLLAQQIFFEGMQFITVQPLAASTEMREVAPAFQYDAAAWSPDGGSLCFVPSNAQATARVLAVDRTQWTDLAPILRSGSVAAPDARIFATACAWGEDGRLAMQYMLNTEQGPRYVGVFDASLAALPGVDFPAVGFPRLLAWLPNGEGFLIQRPGADRWSTEVGIVMLDGTMRILPFVANRVLAALP